jgi:hypothetical protein
MPRDVRAEHVLHTRGAYTADCMIGVLRCASPRSAFQELEHRRSELRSNCTSFVHKAYYKNRILQLTPRRNIWG